MMQAINRRDLEAQTFGDRALALEILVLFTQQAPALLRAIAATAGAARGEIAHRLKGSALAIGAGMLAAAAAELEEAPDDPECVAKVERTLRDVESDIAAIRSE